MSDFQEFVGAIVERYDGDGYQTHRLTRCRLLEDL